MQNSEFEKKIQQQFEEFKFTPAEAVWDNVAAALPTEKKRRRGLLLVLLFAVTIAGYLVIWSTNNKKPVQDADENTVTNNGPNTSGKKSKPLPEAGIPTIKTAVEKATLAATENVKKPSAKKGRNILPETRPENTADDLVAYNVKKLRTMGRLKITTKTPMPTEKDSSAFNEEGSKEMVNNERETAPFANSIVSPTEDSVFYKNISGNIKPLTKNDSMSTAGSEEKRTTEKPKLKWQYGLYTAAGFSNVISKLFSNNPVYDRLSPFVQGSPGASAQPPVIPANPKTNAAFGIGFYASKDVTGRWKFVTGLNYAFHSNSIKAGKKIDSAIVVNFFTTRIGAGSYYQNGNSVIYKNKFHLLEMPLLFQYKLTKRQAFYLEGGVVVNYLVASNAMIYNNNAAAYISNKDIFNKLQVSVNAGAGARIANHSKLPFSIGCQFKYGISSITKNNFGNQHMVSSLLYVKIPVKK